MKTEKRGVYILEREFNVDAVKTICIRPTYDPADSEIKRIITNVSYLYRLASVPRDSIILAPWGLFWVPALWNIIKIKKFLIISLSTDTFLSAKTKNERFSSITAFARYFLAKLTYKVPACYIYSSEIVKDQLKEFGVPQEKLFGRYKMWIMNEKRYKEWQKFKFNNNNKDFIFIGNYYNIMQKRVDILVDAFLMLKKNHPEARLHIIGSGWEGFFGPEKIKYLSKNGIIFYGRVYDIDDIIKKIDFYVHPGEYEAIAGAVLEAMVAGLIPIVTEKGGEKEAVFQVSGKLVRKLSAREIYEGMEYVMKLPIYVRKRLSLKSRKIGLTYSKDNAKKILNKRIKDIIRKYE